MKSSLHISLVTLLVSGLFLLSMPTKSHALVPYGGARINTFPCTCNPSSWIVTLFNYHTKTPLMLVYTPGVSRLYSYFNIFTSRFLLGSYTPGPAPQCLMIAGPICLPAQAIGFPIMGTMDFSPGTGTSL